MTAFGAFVARARSQGRLVVQPRMGMSRLDEMRLGLYATRNAAATTVGTLTVDSYTRTGALDEARRAIDDGTALNGYPIASYPPDVTRSLLRGIADEEFPVQVRHGSARPERIVAALLAAGLDATEGGPVSYCLPYSRLPLREAVAGWQRCCELLAAAQEAGAQPHLETFGGCMMGQLCPPSLLIALSVLEGMFFRQHGLRSISLSYAQQTHTGQDEESVAALIRIAADRLPDIDWHIVIYAYMGVYPQSPGGAQLLLDEAARLSVRTGAARLIVKTTAEAHRIPTVEENVRALETAAVVAGEEGRAPRTGIADTGIHEEACALIDAVLDLDADIGRALVRSFAKGRLDVPYCLHPDNAGRARSGLDSSGRLYWTDAGAMPVAGRAGAGRPATGSRELLDALSYVQRTFDERAFRTVAAPLPLSP
ncbi:methylaspartate mutase [Streptomyces celluloflavus]|uniref:methylaspartate mutase n=1 Tax=Streptomyces celluloflavus TaxID=58344 RepID=UPI00365B0F84